MITSVEKSCCGCSACAQICPRHCISMVSDAEGFIRPSVDQSLCVQCGMCRKVCPEKYRGGVFFKPSQTHIYGLRWRGDQEKLRHSASGGIFYALAREAIDEGGYVFGAAFDETLTVRHIEGTSIRDIERMQNSKYVQSDLGDTFRRIRELLKLPEAPVILFSGTPCQCAGLRGFLGNKVPEKLILIDFVCHGVPSPLLFKKYLSWKTKKIGCPLTKFEFRTKEIGGWNFNGRMSAFMRFNEKVRPNVLDPYMSSFLAAVDYAEACYQCEFATEKKAADITLGDFAGAREEYPEFFSKKGCSIALTPTLKGERYLKRILKYCDTIDVDFTRIDPYAPCLTRPVSRPVERNTLYKGILEMDDDTFVKERLMPERRLKRILNFCFPYGVKRKLRGIRPRR